MKVKRKVEITVETHQVVAIRVNRGRVEVWCPGCAEVVTMVRPEEAAILAGVSLRAIFRRVEADQLHFIETPDGLLRLCLNSLAAPLRWGGAGDSIA